MAAAGEELLEELRVEFVVLGHQDAKTRRGREQRFGWLLRGPCCGCCVGIVERSEDILDRVRSGTSWEDTLAGINGIGPWTIAVFRILVLRHPDVLPLGDVGLHRAIESVYRKKPPSLDRFAARWRPYRSVACWYLWRTLGNQPLG